MQQGEVFGENKLNPMLAVMHTKLTRKVIDGVPHAIRSQCPICEDGMLAVKFAKSTNLPLVVDQCIKCGQKFGYEDEEIDGKRVWAPMGAAFKFRSAEKGGRKALPVHSKDKPYIAPVRIVNPDYLDPAARKLAADGLPVPPYYVSDNSWSLGVWTKGVMTPDEIDVYLVEPLTDEAPFEPGVMFEMFEGERVIGEGKIVSATPCPVMTLTEYLEKKKRDEEAGQGAIPEEA
jgi:hypothetical protein